MLSALPLLIAISRPLHVQWNHMSTQMLVQMGLFDKLSHKSLFTLCPLIDLPFAGHLDFPTIPCLGNGAQAGIWEMQKDHGVSALLRGKPI